MVTVEVVGFMMYCKGVLIGFADKLEDVVS